MLLVVVVLRGGPIKLSIDVRINDKSPSFNADVFCNNIFSFLSLALESLQIKFNDLLKHTTAMY